jgi:hypothetical protein
LNATIAAALLAVVLAAPATFAGPKPGQGSGSKGSGSGSSSVIPPKIILGGSSGIKLTPQILPVSPKPNPKLLDPSVALKKDYFVVKLGSNGHLNLPWCGYVPRHHHHHHHHHWCDCEYIDLGCCMILDRGVLLLQLNEGTAYDEGMMEGDVILSINGKATPDIDTLCDIVQNAGDVVDVVFISGITGRTEAISLYPQDGKLGIIGQGVSVIR